MAELAAQEKELRALDKRAEYIILQKQQNEFYRKAKDQ